MALLVPCMLMHVTLLACLAFPAMQLAGADAQQYVRRSRTGLQKDKEVTSQVGNYCICVSLLLLLAALTIFW